jgi:hypothetical protein
VTGEILRVRQRGSQVWKVLGFLAPSRACSIPASLLSFFGIAKNEMKINEWKIWENKTQSEEGNGRPKMERNWCEFLNTTHRRFSFFLGAGILSSTCSMSSSCKPGIHIVKGKLRGFSAAKDFHLLSFFFFVTQAFFFFFSGYVFLCWRAKLAPCGAHMKCASSVYDRLQNISANTILKKGPRSGWEIDEYVYPTTRVNLSLKRMFKYTDNTDTRDSKVSVCHTSVNHKNAMQNKSRNKKNLMNAMQNNSRHRKKR